MKDSPLIKIALAIRGVGISLLPIDHTTKRPYFRLLPRDEADKPVWEPFTRDIADENTVLGWFEAGALAFAVVCGKVSGDLLVLDFDEERLYHAWREAVGELALGLPVARTGGGGYHVFLCCQQPGENTKLAWTPDENEESGRRIGIETRGEGGYVVVAPSVHPSGAHYEMLFGDLTQIPTISQARADAMIAAARKLDEAPLTRQERERIERETVSSHQRHKSVGHDGENNVISTFNLRMSITEALEFYGYTKGRGGRYIRPGGKSESVSVKDGRSCHWSSDDPLNDGRIKSGMGCHDAFDVYCHYEHGGDVRKAVKTLAQVLGMSAPEIVGTAWQLADGRRQNPSKNTPRADNTPADESAAGVSSVSALKSKLVMSQRIPVYKPFPTEQLPYPLAQFIREAAAAIGCDESFIALPLLVGLAIAIGTTRRIRVKWDWLEFPIVWAVIVASSGQRKSPGFSCAMGPLHEMQHKRFEKHKAAMETYKRELAEYKQALVECKQNGGEPPEEPVKPVLKRLIVNDITIEALAMILEENPRGIGVARDELSGWLSSFNQYKGGKGADASQWLELHRGGLLIVDRKTAERRTIYVPRAATSLCGTIQRGIIKRGYGKEGFENGMVARTLFAMPPARQRQWTDRHIQPHTRDRIADIYASLAELDFDGERNPIDLPLSSDAQAVFIVFVNEHGAEQARLGDERLEAAWSKLEGYAPRMALIVHLVRCAINDSTVADPNRVDAKSVEAGITLVRWFAHETKRVYADMAISDEDRQRLGLIELIQKRNGRITPRDLTRTCRRYSTTADAELALNELVGLKIGEWKYPSPGDSGGRPQKHFVLVPSSADTDETSDSSAAAEVLSAEGAQKQGSVDASDSASSDAEIERMERAAIESDGAEVAVHE